MSEIKRLRKMADKIYAKMENMQRLSDSELKSKTDEFKLRLANGAGTDSAGCIRRSWRGCIQKYWIETV